MSKLKQIYRFLAATALIAVIANVAFPSALAAAKYICNTEYIELSGSSDFGECCSSSSSDTGENQASDHKEQICLSEQVCEQEITTNISQAPVILPEVSQFFGSLTVSGATFLSPLTSTFTLHFLDNAVPVSQPPLFLLNCAFLN